MRLLFAVILFAMAVSACGGGVASTSASSQSQAEESTHEPTQASTEAAGPAGSGPPVTASSTDQDFELTLTSEHGTYLEEQAIAVEAGLTYSGPLAEAVVYGSGFGFVGFTVERVEDAFNPGGRGPASTTDCRPHLFTNGEPVRYPFKKSGSFSGDDPNAAEVHAYLQDPLLRLPPGTWRIVARAFGLLGPGDCAGPELSLAAEILVTVEPSG